MFRYSHNLHSTARTQRRGVIIMLIALLLPVILAMAAFSVDVTFMQLSRAELRAATDAAARAGGEAMSRLQDLDSARQATKDVGYTNIVGGKGLEITDEDIIFGRSETTPVGDWVFDPTGEPINSIRVRGRRTNDSPSGPVNLYFGRVIGTPSFEPVMFATVVKLDRDICLVLDRSSSMKIDLSDSSETMAPELYCQSPLSNTRWTALVEAVDAFMYGIDETPAREHIGMVSYSSDWELCGINNLKSTIDLSLTDNSSSVSSAINNISNTAFNGRTNIAAGIDSGVQVLTDASTFRPFAEKVMVLMTDGRFNEGRDPVEAAQDANAEGIVIHAITFGTGANQADMEEVASVTGGDYYHAPNAAELEDIFYEIGASLPNLLTE